MKLAFTQCDCDYINFSCPKCPDGISISSSDKDRLCEYAALLSVNVSCVDNVCHLTNLDAELNMPVDSNFSYNTLYDFHSNFDISEWLSFKQAFSLPHSNIRSLSGNFEDFTTMLTKLYIPFSVIGLSETKIKFGEQPLINIDLPGYTFVPQNTLSNAGGVGFYVRNDLTFTVLSELSCTTADYEALWIEIQKRHGHDIICGVIYRHPNDNLDTLTLIV